MVQTTVKGFLCAWLLLHSVLGSAAAAGYRDHPAASAFIDSMVARHGFARDYLQQLLAQAQPQPEILEKIARPAEKTKTWGEYSKIFLTEQRIAQGRAFMQQYQPALARAEQRFGVPAPMIAAIIGVETFYGRFKGRDRVIDALATLAFDYPPRSQFFREQLEQYLLLVREQGFDALQPLGSYAGAMGFGQFIPGSYRSYALDFDDDGVIDIIDNPVDAIGSVANYFSRHGWRRAEPLLLAVTAQADIDRDIANTPLKPSRSVAELAALGYRVSAGAVSAEALATPLYLRGEHGEEFWLGLHNFYVVTRYNHSHLYAMAVTRLAAELGMAL